MSTENRLLAALSPNTKTEPYWLPVSVSKLLEKSTIACWKTSRELVDKIFLTYMWSIKSYYLKKIATAGNLKR
ncbi:hypothetical protein BV378_01530 [Nostoc sp. RF31YmG]|nr:hypothetical protein BV378_01530 [Nostoc sp. RF31YmG]